MHCINFGVATDPCCGSGGMFVQSTDLIREKHGDIGRINVYGQEKEAAMAKIFIVHGHDGELKQSVARIIEKQGIIVFL